VKTSCSGKKYDYKKLESFLPIVQEYIDPRINEDPGVNVCRLCVLCWKAQKGMKCFISKLTISLSKLIIIEDITI
jgi:hypothetical protein